MIGLSAVQEVLARPKRLVRDMIWQKNRGRYASPDLVFQSAVQIAGGASIDGLMVLCRWQAQLPPLPVKYSFGLYWDARIFAYDVDALDVHNPRGFAGMPFDGVQVLGSHRHLWTDQGYGYVEPLDDSPGMAALWEFFCIEAGVTGAEFYAPTDPSRSGQMSLL